MEAETTLELSPPEEIGSELPIYLSEMSEADLVAAANRHHREYGRALRKAVAVHVRDAGRALAEMKGRVGHGGWQKWVRQHFTGSLETAAVYMRVAKHWEDVVAAGLDRDGITLAEVREYLKTNAQVTPPSAVMPPDPPMPADNSPVDVGPSSPDDVVQCVFWLSNREKSQLEVMLTVLRAYYWHDNRNDVLFAALTDIFHLHRGDE